MQLITFIITILIAHAPYAKAQSLKKVASKGPSTNIQQQANNTAQASDDSDQDQYREQFIKKLELLSCAPEVKGQKTASKFDMTDFFKKLRDLKVDSKKAINSLTEEEYDDAQLELEDDVVLTTTLWPENIKEKDLAWKIHEDCADRFWKIDGSKDLKKDIKSFKVCIGGQHRSELPEILNKLIRCLEQ